MTFNPIEYVRLEYKHTHDCAYKDQKVTVIHHVGHNGTIPAGTPVCADWLVSLELVHTFKGRY